MQFIGHCTVYFGKKSRLRFVLLFFVSFFKRGQDVESTDSSICLQHCTNAAIKNCHRINLYDHEFLFFNHCPACFPVFTHFGSNMYTCNIIRFHSNVQNHHVCLSKEIIHLVESISATRTGKIKVIRVGSGAIA